ncbi:hypothetical protein [Streptomyces sp. UG1]|uniref:hypothetical protein n=1 Tax=Streptomyces sp. UG1 TaxID=3417652 RepID=UPI003CEE218F
MRHRIARLFGRRYSSGPVGPTVHHTGSRPSRAVCPAAVLGVGVGSVGLPAVIVGGAK